MDLNNATEGIVLRLPPYVPAAVKENPAKLSSSWSNQAALFTILLF
jgi:hypothetical protein